ncbi:MAG: hypothetical protein HFJ60_09360 [Clostridia bacterium]|nr:hypothetical protein [Clostridia bacterium]
MNLDLFNNIINGVKENNLVQSFIKELSDYLKNPKAKENNEMDKNEVSLGEYRKENCLYQVVDRSLKGVYLKNMENNIVFEETNISKELLDKIGNDYILRYKDENYIMEEELTEEFFMNL